MTSGTAELTQEARGKRPLVRWVCTGLCAAVFLIVFRYAVDQRRLADARVDSSNRIRCLSFVCWLFAEEHDGVYPPVDPSKFLVPGPSAGTHSVLEVGEKFEGIPESPDTAILWGSRREYLGYTLDPILDDARYYYLGYAVVSEAEGLALLDAMRDRATRGDPLVSDISAASGAGSFGGDSYVRLRRPSAPQDGQGVDDSRIPDDAFSRIPMLVEDPGHYDTPGGWVVYLDHHTEFLPFPGPFPMTGAFIERLRAARTPR